MKQALSARMILIALPLFFMFSSAAMAGDPAANYYYDGGRQRALLLDDTLVAVFGTAPTAVKSALPGARETKMNGGATIYRAQAGAYKTALGVAPGAAVSPVFHEGGSPAGRMMALPGGVLVNFKADWTTQRVNEWAAAKGLVIGKKLGIGQNWYVIKSPAGQASLDLANQLQQSGEVESASPNWWKEVSTR